MLRPLHNPARHRRSVLCTATEGTMPPGAKMLLLAFDHHYTERGDRREAVDVGLVAHHDANPVWHLLPGTPGGYARARLKPDRHSNHPARIGRAHVRTPGT